MYIGLERQIIKFWTIEEITTSISKSIENLNCGAHFSKNVTHDKHRRYVVAL